MQRRAAASAHCTRHCARLCRNCTSTCLAVRAMPAIALRTMHAPQLDPHPEGRGLCFGCFSGQETKWHVMPSSVFGCAPLLYSLSLHSSNHHFLNFLFVTAIKVKFFLSSGPCSAPHRIPATTLQSTNPALWPPVHDTHCPLEVRSQPHYEQ